MGRNIVLWLESCSSKSRVGGHPMVTLSADTAEFRFLHPLAKRVCLVGDFNGWQIGQTQMQRRQNGQWVVSMNLSPGTYRFRYWADGLWFTDYAAFGVEHGPFGANSVLWIPRRTSLRRCPLCAQSIVLPSRRPGEPFKVRG